MSKFLEKVDPSIIGLLILSGLGTGFIVLGCIFGRQQMVIECLDKYPPDNCLQFFNSFWF